MLCLTFGGSEVPGGVDFLMFDEVFGDVIRVSGEDVDHASR